jgi:transposase
MPGAAVSAVAGWHGLTPQQVFDWRRRARQAGETSGETPGEAPMMFAPIVVASDGTATDMPVAEIAIGQARVLVAPDIDPARITAVLRAVRKTLRRSCRPRRSGC